MPREIATLKPISLASALAVSGAALNPSAGSDGGGPTRSGMLPLTLSLLGIRLGYWLPNPQRFQKESRIRLPNFIKPGLYHGILQRGHREDSDWIELTDGGHFENMGLYELFRRKVKVIIAADGSTDPDLSLSSFASAYERARNDFGVEIDIANYPANFNDMTPDSARPNSHIKRRYKLAEHGFAIGVITYKGDLEPGYIFYVNTVLTENLRPNLYSYRAEHPEFPDEPLTDQFFNEKQFDAYCQLGNELAEQMLRYARRWTELSAALGMKPNGNAKPWEKNSDAEYITAEELIARGLGQVGGAINDLAKHTTVERIAGIFRKPGRKG